MEERVKREEMLHTGSETHNLQCKAPYPVNLDPKAAKP